MKENRTQSPNRIDKVSKIELKKKKITCQTKNKQTNKQIASSVRKDKATNTHTEMNQVLELLIRFLK